MQIRKLVSQSEKYRRHRGDLEQLGSGTIETIGSGEGKTTSGSTKNRIDKRKARQQQQTLANSITGDHDAKILTHEGEVDGMMANSIVIANKMADLGTKGEERGDQQRIYNQAATKQRVNSNNEDNEMKNRPNNDKGIF